MSAHETPHDPKNLYRRLACAAEEAKGVSGVAFLDAFDKALDDVRLAGFPRLAEGLGAIVAAARREVLEDADLAEEHADTVKELDGALTKIEELESALKETKKLNKSLLKEQGELRQACSDRADEIAALKAAAA